MAQAVNVPDLISAFTTFGGGIAKSAADLSQEQGKIIAAKQAEIDANNKIGEAQAKVTQTQGLAEIKRIKDTAAAATAVGRNPDAASYLLTTLSSEILAKEEDIRKRDSAIREKLDTKFLDDPLGFLYNQLSAPFDVAARNLVAVETQSRNAQLKEASLRFNEQALINTGIAETITTESLAAATTINLQNAVKASAIAAADLAKSGIDVINIRNAMNAQQWHAVVQYQDAKRAEQALALQAAAGARAQKELEMSTERHKIFIQEHKDKQEQEAIWQTRINKAAQVMNADPITVKEFMSLGTQQRAAWESVMIDPDIQRRGMLGITPAKALDTTNNMQLRLTSGGEMIRKALTDIKNTVAAMPLNANTFGAGGKLEEKQRLTDEAIKEQVKKEYANTPITGSIFSPPPLLATLAIPMIKNLPIVKELYALGVSNNLYPTSATDIFNSGSRLIREGKLTPHEAAAQAAMVYRGIVSDNMSQRPYSKFALEAPSKHNTTVYFTGFGNSKVFDVTSMTQWEAEFTRFEAYTKFQTGAIDTMLRAPSVRGVSPEVKP